MLSVETIPSAWKHALNAVQKVYPQAIMAGGCLRDRDHGVKVKDIDIFISDPRFMTPDHARRVADDLRLAGWADVKLSDEKTYSNDKGNIAGVIDAKFPQCPLINIIVGSWPEPLISGFDFGICQISFDGKRLASTADYRKDDIASQFRLIPEVTDKEFVRSLNRWARIKERYPTWTLNLGSRASSTC